jgi:hypothetical protein
MQKKIRRKQSPHLTDLALSQLFTGNQDSVAVCLFINTKSPLLENLCNNVYFSEKTRQYLKAENYTALLFTLVLSTQAVWSIVPDFDNTLRQPLSVQLAQASQLCSKGRFEEAELRYRRLLNAVQLTRGYAHRDVKPIVEGWAVALSGMGRSSEAEDARRLAEQLSKGLLPISSNGAAYMRNDESIVIFKRIATRNAIGGSFVRLTSNDAAYAGTIAMLAGLQPGQTKLLAPLSADSAPDEASALANTKEDSMTVYSEFNYRIRNSRGIKTMKLKNSEIPRMLLYVTGLRLSLVGMVSSNPVFLAAYYEDTEKLTIGERIALAYFLQPRPAGLQETFAWLYVAANEEESSEELIILKDALPHVFELVRNEKLAPSVPKPKIVT